eukprot:jgi/Phyca11/508159/fgenesh2_kg.PHYCAscaffold_33_\
MKGCLEARGAWILLWNHLLFDPEHHHLCWKRSKMTITKKKLKKASGPSLHRLITPIIATQIGRHTGRILLQYRVERAR